ncbi:type I restriction endonuclease subunit R [Chloroflexota bacterium]
MYSELKQVELPLVKTLQKLDWEYIASVELDELRDSYDNPFILSYLRDAIVKLNSRKGITEEHADAIIHRLQRIDNNEEFSTWLKGEQSFKYSPSENAVSINLIDTEDLTNNRFTVTNQFKQSITHGVIENEKHIKPDIVLFINGIPTTVIECKVLSTEESTYQEGIKQIERYQNHSPRMFVSNCFNISTDGHILKYGATSSSSGYFFEWKDDGSLPDDFDETDSEFIPSETGQEYNPFIDRAVYGLFNHKAYVDLIQNFIVFETVENVTIKKVARYQQFRATNKIVNRVLNDEMRTGLVWHTQGSGKSLTMLFTAWKLRKHPSLSNPTVLIVVDRKDLDNQITGTFISSKLPNTVRANSIQDLRDKLIHDRREVIISTVFKFDELKDVLVERDNVIVLIDEAHRSQEGLNAIEMRGTLKNACFIGFTGTPIDKSDHNTHRNFGLRPDGQVERYLDLYNIRQSIEDGATVPVHYQLRNMKWHPPDADMDKILAEEYPSIDDDTMDELKTRASTYGTFMMKPERLRSIAEDIAEHFTEHAAPNDYKAQVVGFTRRACVKIKKHLDELLGYGISDIIYTGAQNDDDELRKYHYSSEKQRDIIGNFKNSENPLKILLVQSMLLTGFDAPVEQVMYLDRPIRDHTLLQAIARTNRPYKNKQCGIIIDYCGILKHLDKALNFNENEIESCLIDFDELKSKLPDLIDEFKHIFTGINTANLWQCLRHIETNKLESRVNNTYKKLQAIYETIAPDPFLLDYSQDYKWATELVVALRQMNGNKKPDVRDYMANTQKLIQEHVDISKIDQTAPVFVVDDNYLRRIDELPPDRGQREALLEKRLRALLVVRIGNLPIYQTLMDRLGAIIVQKGQEIQDTLELLTKLTGDINEAMKEEQAMSLSKGETAIRQLVNARISSNATDEIAAVLNKVVTEHIFQGWQVQPSVRATIKRDIILELAKYAKAHPEVDLDPDDYSKFSQEAMKYVEKHF